MLERKPSELVLKNDKFQLSEKHNGAWAQDSWGIVKNTLLARDNLDDISDR